MFQQHVALSQLFLLPNLYSVNLTENMCFSLFNFYVFIVPSQVCNGFHSFVVVFVHASITFTNDYPKPLILSIKHQHVVHPTSHITPQIEQLLGMLLLLFYFVFIVYKLSDL